MHAPRLGGTRLQVPPHAPRHAAASEDHRLSAVHAELGPHPAAVCLILCNTRCKCMQGHRTTWAHLEGVGSQSQRCIQSLNLTSSRCLSVNVGTYAPNLSQGSVKISTERKCFNRRCVKATVTV